MKQNSDTDLFLLILDTYILFYLKIVYSSGSSEQIKCLISLSEILDHVSFEAAFSPIPKLKLVGLSPSDFPSYNLDTFSLHCLFVLIQIDFCNCKTMII